MSVVFDLVELAKLRFDSTSFTKKKNLFDISS
jgi:hypothetical protein